LERRLEHGQKNKTLDGKQNTKSTKQAYEFSVDRVIERYAGSTE
jgi:hypothetical protein